MVSRVSAACGSRSVECSNSLLSIPTVKELFADHPELEEEDLRQALAYAAANLEDEAEAASPEMLTLIASSSPGGH